MGVLPHSAITESPRVRRILIAIALLFFVGILVLPLSVVFYHAFEAGVVFYGQSLFSEEGLAATQLTLWVALCCVPLNTIFGIAAAWCITKFEFRGKRLLISLIDLPFSVSPVVAGFIFIMLFGEHSFLGGWLQHQGIRIIFAFPGIVIATLFITVPFVARELIPLLEEQGVSEEEAALVLGANPWQMFFHVTLPNMKWGLLYGVVLLTMRAMGEFGAVSVVSGHIQGETNTLPLQIEVLYNEYQFTAAFALSSLLTLLALSTLVVKQLLSKQLWRKRRTG